MKEVQIKLNYFVISFLFYHETFNKTSPLPHEKEIYVAHL